MKQLMMVKIIRKEWLIGAILLLALLVRVVGLGSMPQQLTPDEAALGYNAYSILKTGKDEHGVWFPLIFESFGDFKPGLYVYMTVPFVAVLGLNELATRLPSALMGVMGVLALYGILRNQLESSWTLGWKKWTVVVTPGHIVALFLAFNPYHLWFSRGAWESQVALSLVLLSVWCLLRGLRRASGWWLVGSATLMGSSFIMYQGAKMSSLLVMLLLVGFYGREVWRMWNWKWLVMAGGVFLLIVWPMVSSVLGGNASRLGVVSILNYQAPQEYMEARYYDPTGLTADDWQMRLFYNPWMMKFRMILDRYMNYFGARFLVIEGDWHHPWTSVPYHGVLYWVELPLLLVGLVTVILAQRRIWWFMLGWLLVAPLPGALTLDPINAVRSMYMIAPLIAFIGYGAWWLIDRLRTERWRLMATGGLLVVLGLSWFNFMQLVKHVYPVKHLSSSYYVGYDKLAQQALAYSREYNVPIIIEPSYAQPQIYVLFYGQIDPLIVQTEAEYRSENENDVNLPRKISDDIRFDNLNWQKYRHDGNIVIAGRPSEFQLDELPAEQYELTRIMRPNGVEIYYVMYIRPEAS